jgi:ketosteroid isomerase-like protein
MKWATVWAWIVGALLSACGHEDASAPVAEVERDRAEAIERRDATAYARLTSPDFFVVERDGSMTTRGERLADVAEGEPVATRRGEAPFTTRWFGNLAVVYGRSRWQREGKVYHDYISRIWARHGRGWQLIATHDTDISDQVNTASENFHELAAPVPTLPLTGTPRAQTADADVRFAAGEQHRAYWGKDPDRYRRFAGSDLIRIAENGVSTREIVIAAMRGNARLPAPPSEQRDLAVRLYGNVAVATWLDVGVGPRGEVAQTRFTVVFGYRGRVWQMVHIQSTGIRN